MTQDESQKKKTKEKEPDITFFHPDILEVPQDGSLPYLKGYRCKKCGQLDFKVTLCTGCWGEEFDMVPLSRRGKVYSFSDIYIGQQGLATPYIFAYVDLPENLRVGMAKNITSVGIDRVRRRRGRGRHCRARRRGRLQRLKPGCSMPGLPNPLCLAGSLGRMRLAYYLRIIDMMFTSLL